VRLGVFFQKSPNPSGRQSVSDRARQWIVVCFFGYNLPVAIARELFNLLRIQQVSLVRLKNIFLIWVRGSPGTDLQSGGVFSFLTNFDGPWTPIQWVEILAETFFGN